MNKFKAAFIVLLGLLSFKTMAEDRYLPKPYIGLDIQHRANFLVRDYGPGLTPHTINQFSPQANIYGGLLLTDYIALEAGVSRSVFKEVHWRFKNKWNSFHVGTLNYLPVFKDDNLKLILGIGFSKVTLKSEHCMRWMGIFCIKETVKRIVPRATVGIQYMYTDTMGIRLGSVFENTSQLNSDFFTFKDSVSYSIGLTKTF